MVAVLEEEESVEESVEVAEPLPPASAAASSYSSSLSQPVRNPRSPNRVFRLRRPRSRPPQEKKKKKLLPEQPARQARIAVSPWPLSYSSSPSQPGRNRPNRPPNRTFGSGSVSSPSLEWSKSARLAWSSRMISLYSPQNEQIDTIETTTITFDSRSSFCLRSSRRMSPQSRRFRRREAAKTSMTNALDKMCGPKLFFSLSLFRYRYYYTMRRRNPRVSRIGELRVFRKQNAEDDEDECIISRARVYVARGRKKLVKKEDI